MTIKAIYENISLHGYEIFLKMDVIALFPPPLPPDVGSLGKYN